ncbi:MAG TPA: peptidylprolyl isomerase, partial [Ilumatobacter sp.]|nr:peptidylprolyl isomerase [Ilumatobacter sp.]
MATPFPALDGSAPKQQEFRSAPELGIDPAKRYTATMSTSMGDMVIALDPVKAPKTVNNFVFLALHHYFDGIIFHRIINGFMCQGGDPTGTGRGGPGYQYAGEFKPDVKHDKPGKLSMANAGPGTDGSQFFLTFVATPHLDGNHTVFGTIVEGGDTTMKELEKRGSPSGATKEPMSIKKATIEVTDA